LDVAEALGNLTGASQEKIALELQAIARERTAEADVELDEDGKPIEKKEVVKDELAGDESTVIIEANAAPPEANETLFAESEKPRKRRMKRSE
jgi:hypothetical protein